MTVYDGASRSKLPLLEVAGRWIATCCDANNQEGPDKTVQLLSHFLSHLRELDGDAKAGTPTSYGALDD
jgi:hypothetical protein